MVKKVTGAAGESFFFHTTSVSLREPPKLALHKEISTNPDTLSLFIFLYYLREPPDA